MFSRRVALIVLCGLILLIAFGIIDVFSSSIRAHYFVNQVGRLQVGKSSFADAQEVARRIKAVHSDDCSPTDCFWHVSTTNWSIPKWWRGEGSVFNAGFRVQDSVVTERSFSFQIGVGLNVPSVDVDEKLHWRGNTTEPVFVGTQYTASTPHYRSYVRLTPAVPEETRARYLAFNLSCLWKYQGCKDAQDLLPTVVWK